MRYLVSITPETGVNDEIDRSGGIMPLLSQLRETFKPEAFYLEAAQRKIWMVIDFETAGRLNQLTCIGIFKFGARPEFRPLFTETENTTAIPESLALMESMP